MKTPRLTPLALMLSLFSVTHASLSVQMEGTILTLDTALVEIHADANGRVDWVTSDEVHWLSRIGEPRIPWQRFTLLLPPDANLATVEASLTEVAYEDRGAGFYVEPTAPWLTYDEQGQAIEVWPENRTFVDGEDISIYQEAADWPGETTVRQQAGSMRRWRVLEVAVPLAGYEPVTGTVRLLQTGTLQIDFSRSGDDAVTTLIGAERIQQRVVNYDCMARQYRVRGTRAFSTISTLRRGDSDDHGQVEVDPNAEGYCIVTTNTVVEKSEVLEDFVTFKRDLGFNVWVVTEDDYGTATGQSRANNIRAWLQENYLDYGLIYVLLIGNPSPSRGGDLPMKMCYDDSPTDYFYGELTGDWDSNGNGVYGEKEDYPEKYFEVYVGRIPYYGDVDDIDGILTKTMDYESSSDVSWRRHVYLPMVPLDDNTPCYALGEQVKEDLLEPEMVKSTRHYQENYDLNPAPEYLLDEDYPATVWSEHEYGAVLWMTHGNATKATGVIDIDDVRDIDDAHPAAVWQGSCKNSYPEESDNLAFTLLKNGAITTCAGTRNTYYVGGKTDYTTGSTNGPMIYYYLQYLVERKSCGAALALLREKLSLFPLNYYRYNLYGDPSVVVFPERPALTVFPTDTFCMRTDVEQLGTESRTYRLYNNSEVPLTWQCLESPDWATLSATDGVLEAGASMEVGLTLNAADMNGCGIRAETLEFEAIGLDVVQSRDIKIEVNPFQLVGHWRLDETQGQEAIDDSGTGLHGSLQNFSFDTSSVEGYRNTGLDFDGRDDSIELPQLDFSLADGFSVCLWMHPETTASSWTRFMDLGDPGGTNNILLSLRGSSAAIAVNVSENGEAGDRVIVSDAFASHAWQFLTVTLAADGTASIYVDGERLVAGTTGRPGTEMRLCNYIGMSPWTTDRVRTYRYEGIMDDIWMQDHVLTQSEILDLMAGGPADAPSPRDGSCNQSTDSILTWKGSPAVQSYELYFGADANSLEYQGGLDEAVFIPTLAKDRTYAWRVDTVTADRTIIGDLWIFNTRDANEVAGLCVVD